MVARDEDDLICDFAEYYHIYDWRGLPLKLAAVLAFGLSDDSRSKRGLNGHKLTLPQLMMAMIVDRLSTIMWFQSEDGRKGENRPKSLVAILTGSDEEKKPDIRTFKSGAEFEDYLKKARGVK